MIRTKAKRTEMQRAFERNDTRASIGVQRTMMQEIERLNLEVDELVELNTQKSNALAKIRSAFE